MSQPQQQPQPQQQSPTPSPIDRQEEEIRWRKYWNLPDEARKCIAYILQGALLAQRAETEDEQQPA